MAGNYKHIIDGWTWSYSRLNSFDTCPYQWFLKYIMCYEEEPSFYASYGSFIHKIIEEYYRGTLKSEDMLIRFLSGFSSEVKGERPKQSTVEKYIKAGVDYFKTFEPFPYEMVDVEKRLYFEVAGEKFVGIIDFLGEKDGELVIVDNKSRDLKPRSNRKTPTLKDQDLDDMLKQLYLYSAGVLKKYGKLPAYLCFNCFKNRQFIIEPFNIDTYHSVLKWAESQIKYIKSTEIFNPNVDFFQCKNLCGLQDECCYYDIAFGR